MASPLINREGLGFLLRETVQEPGVKFPRHSHENAHVAFVMRGVFNEECEKKTLECRPLSVSFLVPGAMHSDDFRSGAHAFLLELAPQRFQLMREHLKLDEPVCLYGGLPAWLMMRLYKEARRTDGASVLAVEGLVLEVLAAISRCQLSSPDREAPPWLQRAKELIHDQFNERLTHDDIARMVGVHPVHLASTFRQHYECTLGEYVRRLRIEFACREISTGTPLSDVALAAGFSDQSHFAKVFKRLTGMTPRQFRLDTRTP